MDIRSLVPKDKHDISSITELKGLSDTETEPIISELLQWMQDMNWPVADDIAEILSMHAVITAPYAAELLKPEQKDEIWKFNIINYLLKRNKSFSENALIISEIERIAASPTKGEQGEFVDSAAKEYLQEI